MLLARAKSGDTVALTPAPDGGCVSWNGQATVSITIVLDLGRTRFCATRVDHPLLRVTADQVWIRGGRFSGDRTPGETVISMSGSQAIVEGLSCELVDTCVEQPRGAGFFNVYEHVLARNVATAVLHFEDGVGPIVTDMQYDTDNRQWAPASAASYPEPRRGCLWVQTEGLMFSALNATHCGDGLRIETTDFRHIEWIKGSDSFFDSGLGGAGIHIINDEIGAKPGTTEPIHLRGIFLNGVWSATNTRGLWVEGRGLIDGVFWNGGEIHNNLNEGVRIDSPSATNIRFNDTVLSGNNAANGEASNFYTNTSGSVSCRSCFFGRAMQWQSLPYDHVLTDKAQSGALELSGSFFDVAGVKHFVIDKRGSGAIGIDQTEGSVARARGLAIIPAGRTAIEVDPALNVPFGMGNVMVSAAAPTPAYVASVETSRPHQKFTIGIPAPRQQATSVTWDVEVRSL